MKYFELQILETTSEHFANWLYGEMNALPPGGIVLGQPPNQEEIEITGFELIPPDTALLGHYRLEVHGHTTKVGPEFMIGEAKARLDLGVGRKLEPIISIELRETGHGKVHLLGECTDYMTGYVRHLIERAREYYHVQELKPAAAKQENSLTWSKVSHSPMIDTLSLRQIKVTAPNSQVGDWPMLDSSSDLKRKMLTEQLVDLHEEYEAANKQLMSTLSKADCIRIERQIEGLEIEIKKVEEQIKRISDESGHTDDSTEENAQKTESLADVLVVKQGRGGGCFKSGPAQWWIRLKVESIKPISDCWGQIYDVQRLVDATDQQGMPLPESQTTILSWDPGTFAPVSLQPHEPKYLDLAWRANNDPPILDDELRIASALDRGKRNTASPNWGKRQDFIPLKPGHYLLIVRFLATGYDVPLERRYHLHWPGQGQESDIQLSEVSNAAPALKSKTEHKPSSEIAAGKTIESKQTPTGIDDALMKYFGEHVRWLWLFYLAWLAITALGFMASLVEVFGLTPCLRYQIFACLALIGGLGILALSFLPALKQRYTTWDCLFTFILLVLATGSLGGLASQSCSQTAPMISGFDYKVRVEVKGTGQPIESAKVTIEAGNWAPKNEFTDSNGVARIYIDASSAGKPGRLIVEATGYKRYTENIDLAAGDLPDVIQLEQEP